MCILSDVCTAQTELGVTDMELKISRYWVFILSFSGRSDALYTNEGSINIYIFNR